MSTGKRPRGRRKPTQHYVDTTHDNPARLIVEAWSYPSARCKQEGFQR